MFRDSDKELAFFQLKSLLVTHLRDKAFTPLSLPYKVVPQSRIAPSSDPPKNARLYFSKKGETLEPKTSSFYILLANG